VVGLSTSLMVSVPELEMSAAALVSVRLRTSAESAAASFCAVTLTTNVKPAPVLRK
jgi:hypothetical protein